MSRPAPNTSPCGKGALSSDEWSSRVVELDKAIAVLEAQRSFAIGELARAHVAEHTLSGVVEPEKLERGAASRIAVACRVSPTEARKRMRVARDLSDGLSHVRDLFRAGEISEHKASAVVTACSHLDTEARAQVDRLLTSHHIEEMGVGKIRALAQRLAAEIAPDEFLDRCRAARGSRRVSVRPATDGMADLIAHLPVEEAVACYAALTKAVNDAYVDPEPLTRSKGQIMADTLVERVTGHRAGEVPIEVQVVVPIEALIDPSSPLPAELPGYGPVPADLIKDAKTWRRLITTEGVVIGGDSRQRTFTGVLAELIKARDGHRCRARYCDAPIRHIDHITRWSDGGRTSFDNGRGLCEFHNLVREIDDISTTDPLDGVRNGTTASRPSTTGDRTLAHRVQVGYG